MTELQELLEQWKSLDNPDVYKSYKDILNDGKITNKYDFKEVYRNLNEIQKFNAVRFAFRFFIKENKCLKDILKLLEKDE